MTAEKQARIHIVVPAFNEAPVIRSVLAELLARYPECVVVNDASTDGTAEELARLPVTVLTHVVNRGQGAALQTGIEYCLNRGAQYIVTFDADGQHRPEDIEKLVAPLLRGECEVVLGSRFLGAARNITFVRRCVLKAGVLFTRVFSRIRVTDTHNGLRAFTRRAAGALGITMDGMAHGSEILDQIARLELPFREVPVEIVYSDYSVAKGQGSLNALRITAQLLFKRISK